LIFPRKNVNWKGGGEVTCWGNGALSKREGNGPRPHVEGDAEKRGREPTRGGLYIERDSE